jgi:hypothetical protein
MGYPIEEQADWGAKFLRLLLRRVDELRELLDST